MSKNTKIEIKQDLGDVKDREIVGLKVTKTDESVTVVQTGGNVSGSTIVGIRIGSN